MNDPIDDKTLDEYLSGSSQISQRYRELDDAGVPSQLDQLVLTRARDAVAGKQPSSTDELERLRRRRKRLMQWSVPAGLAASAVLVVSIVMQSGVQHEVSLPQSPASAPTAVQERDDRSGDKQEGLVAFAPRETNDTSSVNAAPPPALIPEVPAADVPAAAERRTLLEGVETNAKRLRQQTQDSVSPVTTYELAKESAFASSIEVPAPSPLAANAPPAATLQIPQVVQQSTSARAVSSTAIEPTTAISQTAISQTAQPRDTGAQGSATEAEAARNEEAKSRRAASQADYDLSEIAVTGSRVSRSAPAAGNGPRGTVPPSASAESLPDEAVSKPQFLEEPKQWLERIRQLRQDGKKRDADREWKRFREAYPDYAVAENDAARAK